MRGAVCVLNYFDDPEGHNRRDADQTAERLRRYQVPVHVFDADVRSYQSVEALMRRDADLRLASTNDTVREVFTRARRRGRRTGAIMLVDAAGRLCGLFTDSDLARLFEQRRDAALDRSIAEVMTPNPLTVHEGSRVLDAVEILRRRLVAHQNDALSSMRALFSGIGVKNCNTARRASDEDDLA